jgi:hypothetical protein
LFEYGTWFVDGPGGTCVIGGGENGRGGGGIPTLVPDGGTGYGGGGFCDEFGICESNMFFPVN